VLTRKTTFHVGVGSHPEKDRIVLGNQAVEINIRSDIHAESEFDTHAFHYLAALFDHVLLELEGRNSERQQSTDACVTVKHNGCDAVTHQNVRAAQARGARANDRNPLAGRLYMGHVGFPSPLECLIGDVLLDGTDSYRAQPVVEGAGTLAKPVL